MRPRAGAWVRDSAQLVMRQGGSWSGVDAEVRARLGVGHQLKINKASASDTASLLFQSGWTGHAEIGLVGDTSFSLKVSPDGSTWTEALRADPASGHLSGATLSGAVPTGAGAGSRAARGMVIVGRRHFGAALDQDRPFLFRMALRQVELRSVVALQAPDLSDPADPSTPSDSSHTPTYSPSFLSSPLPRSQIRPSGRLWPQASHLS